MTCGCNGSGRTVQTDAVCMFMHLCMFSHVCVCVCACVCMCVYVGVWVCVSVKCEREISVSQICKLRQSPQISRCEGQC